MRPPTLHLSITTKLVAYLLLAGIVPLLVFGLSALHIARAIVVAQAGEYSTRLASDSANYLQLYREQIEDLAASIAGNEAIARALKESDESSAGSYERLNTRAQVGYILNSFIRVKGLVSIDLFTPAGKHFTVGQTLNISDIRQEAVREMIYNAELSKRANNWQGVIDNVNRYSPQAKVITLARLIRYYAPGSRSSTTAGLLLININDEAFGSFGPRDPARSKVRMMAIDSGGRLMHHWNRALFGQPLARDLLARIRGHSDSVQLRLDGEDVIMTSAPLFGTDGYLTIVTPLALQTAPVNRLAATCGALLLLGIAAIAWLTRHYVKTVVAPLRSITKRFRHLHENPELAHSPLPEPRVYDEIATLIKGFNSHLEVLAVQRAAAAKLKQAEQSAQESAARFRSIIEATPAPLAINDAQGRITYLNQYFVRTVGYTLADIPTLDDWWQKAFPDPHRRQTMIDSWQDHLLQARRDDHAFAPLEAEIRCQNGVLRTFMLSMTPLRDEVSGASLMILFDITERKTAEEAINNLAFYDSLTGLPNRRLLLDRLKQALASCNRSGRHGAVLYIDLDNFKTLNDTLGHETGDFLLQQVARRLASCVRGADTVARLGGDEFVVMLEDLGDSIEESADQARIVGEKIVAVLNAPYPLPGNHEHRSTPSIGIALFASDQDTVDDLLRHADLAMYQAKTAGRNTLRFFDPQMQAAIMARAALEDGLRLALSDGQFVLHYQPQVDSTGCLTGVEALLRWQHPQHGLVPPGQFIPMAEETGLIVALGEWVVETACAQLKRWAADPEMEKLTLAVNVSARQIHDPRFVERIVAALDGSGANPRRLKLELTESLLVDDVENVIIMMDTLQAKGVGFSLDDFGTGYSSLSYLKRLPLDQLKIDQGFVRDILTDPNDAAIAEMIIALAATLGLAVIAEGVESEAQRDHLRQMGCHLYQGYYFSRPLPIDAFESYARRTGVRSAR